MKIAKYVACPHCGNADQASIEDNGVSPSDVDYTLLCVARVKPERAALASFEPKPKIGPDGKVACGMEWCPND